MSDKHFHQNFDAIGTSWIIDIYGDVVDIESSKKLIEIINKRIEKFDKTYSRFRDDSLITKIAQNTGTFTFPNDSNELFTLYEDLYHLTEGAFTPLIGNLLEDAGYDKEYSLQTKILRPSEKWQDTFEFNNNKIFVKKPVLLDFGAAGKGYLVDILSEILFTHGFKSFCVDGGGDMFYCNKTHKPLSVGLEHPTNLNQVIGVASILNQSICGSSGNRRKWANYTHIINPFTLSSPTDKLAIWVTASTTILADALTTCLFFVSPELLLEKYQFEYAIVHSDYSLQKSDSFAAEFFVK